MARLPRINSSIGMNHIILRGVNKKSIFLDDSDRRKFLKCLLIAHEKSDFILHAYCLMDNHVHMLIQANTEPLGETVKRFAVSYAAYFNRKYDRVGHLFQDRFRSVPVETEDSYLRVVRYILQNPVKAGVCSHVADYRWSSYHSLGKDDGFTDSRLVNKIADAKYIRQFMNSIADDAEMDIIEKTPVTDSDVVDIMRELCGLDTIEEFLNLDEIIQAEYIQRMVNRGCRINQIRRVFEISEYRMRKMRTGRGTRRSGTVLPLR